MSGRITLATATRVLLQLRRDPRTLALVFVVPPVLLALFRYVFDGQDARFDRLGGRSSGCSRSSRCSSSRRSRCCGNARRARSSG